MLTDFRNHTSKERLMEHVSAISQWVRLSGSPEEGNAFDYIETKLQDWRIAYQRFLRSMS